MNPAKKIVLLISTLAVIFSSVSPALAQITCQPMPDSGTCPTNIFGGVGLIQCGTAWCCPNQVACDAILQTQPNGPTSVGSFADGPWYNQTPEQFRKKVFDNAPDNEIFGERYTFAPINWIINSL